MQKRRNAFLISWFVKGVLQGLQLKSVLNITLEFVLGGPVTITHLGYMYVHHRNKGIWLPEKLNAQKLMQTADEVGKM